MPNESPKDVKKAFEVRSSYEDPKKHFVRVNGWLPAARMRLKKNRRTHLRYFTLCGQRAIDVLHLRREGLLRHDGRGYPELVFCEEDRNTYTQIDRLLRVYKRGFLCPLEKIADEPEFESVFPFDIINLDLTRSCFPKREPPTSSTIKSIARMIESQKGINFDLFITFRAESAAENKEAIQILRRNMEQNFKRNPELEDVFLKVTHAEPAQLVSQDYVSFIMKCFPKLIIRYGYDNDYLVHCDQEYKYKRFPPWRKRYFILKFLFDFDADRLKEARTATDDIDQRQSRLEREQGLFSASIKDSIEMNAVDVDASLNTEMERTLERDLSDLLGFRV